MVNHSQATDCRPPAPLCHGRLIVEVCAQHAAPMTCMTCMPPRINVVVVKQCDSKSSHPAPVTASVGYQNQVSMSAPPLPPLAIVGQAPSCFSRNSTDIIATFPNSFSFSPPQIRSSRQPFLHPLARRLSGARPGIPVCLRLEPRDQSRPEKQLLRDNRITHVRAPTP
jgi:hypothetical protein